MATNAANEEWWRNLISNQRQWSLVCHLKDTKKVNKAQKGIFWRVKTTKRVNPKMKKAILFIQLILAHLYTEQRTKMVTEKKQFVITWRSSERRWGHRELLVEKRTKQWMLIWASRAPSQSRVSDVTFYHVMSMLF